MKKYLALFITLLSVNSGIANAKMCNGQLGLACEIVETKNSLAEETINTSLVSINDAQSGLKVTSGLNVWNNKNYGFVGVLSAPSVNGFSSATIQKMTGVQGTVFKNSASANATGLRCSVYDFIPGGSSTCLSVDFPMSQAGTATTGIDMQPPSYAADLVGISFEQNPQAYKYTVDHAGAPVSMGTKNGVRYCLQFNDATADLEYIKNCGTNAEQIVGKVMIVSQPSTPNAVPPNEIGEAMRNKFIYPHPLYNP